MRLLSVTFENLNSLRGRHSIDFRQPCFNAGLFAIVGDTGAGKSTILDAICLALYHQTPRLGLIASDNQIMSRGAGECMAEVEFETTAGGFRASWHQHRARRKPDGKLANATCTLDHLTGTPITTSVKEKLSRIVEVIGLSYEQFTRSVLLSQGEFAKFLTADEGARADLLEKLTGTEVYAEISKRVYARAGEAASDVALLKAAADGIELLSTERLAELEASRERLRTETDAARSTLENLRKDEAWRSNVDQANDALLKNQALCGELASQWAAQEPLRASIQIAERAERLRPDIERVDGAVVRIQKADAQLSSLQAQRPTFEDALAAAVWCALQVARREKTRSALALGEAEGDIRLIEGRLQSFPDGETLIKRFPVWSEMAGQLDAAISGRTRAQDAVSAAIKKAREAEEQENELATRLAGANEELGKLQLARDEAIGAFQQTLEGRRLEDVRHDLDALRERKSHLSAAAQTREALEDAQTDLAALQQQIGRTTEQLAGLQEDASGKKISRDLAEEAWKLQQQRRDLAREVRTLEEQRARLVEGEPCVLCGSLEHPYADPAAVPPVDEIERACSAARSEFETRDTAWMHATAVIAALEAEQRGLQRQLARAEEDGERRRGALVRACQAAGIAPEDDVPALSLRAATELAEMVERVVQIEHLDSVARAAADVVGPAREHVQRLEADLRVARAATETAKTHVDECTTALSSAIEAVGTHAKRLADDVPGGLPDDLHQWRAKCQQDIDVYTNLKQALATRSETLPALQQVSTDAGADEAHWNARWAALNLPDRPDAPWIGAVLEECARDVQSRELALRDLDTMFGTLKDQRLALDDELRDAQQNLQSRVSESNFEDFAQCRAALVEPAQLESMRREVGELDQQIQAANGAKDALTKTLGRLRDEARTEASLEQIQDLIRSVSNEFEERMQALGQVSTAISTDRENRERLAGKLDAIAQAEAVSAEWSQLNDLIGSADGKKFRKFAQGLTLDRLVELANTHLVRLEGGRYRISRGSALDLRIIDAWDADAERDAKTLSGGESFQVSLSLALALSDLVSHRTSIDTFLLDEGFGTLSEDCLNTALDALEALQNSCKLIGVISHVPQVKERIATQIRVVKNRGGSRIELPL